jgi:hypothetical protein
MIHLIFVAYITFCSIAMLGRTGDYKVALWMAAVGTLCYILGGFAAVRDRERDMYDRDPVDKNNSV